MNNSFQRWNMWIGRRMFMLTIGGVVAGYLFPISSTWTLRMITVVLFAYATLVTSMGTSFRHFVSVLKKPRIPLWILLLTHLVTPLIAWGAGYLFYPDDTHARLGFLIATSVPIGVSSIVWTALAKGNVAISLVAVSIDTAIVPVMLPVIFMLLVGASVKIDYWGMALQLLGMVTIPSLVGMVWNDRASSKVMSFYSGLGGVTSRLIILAVIYINSALALSGVVWSLTVLKTALVTLFMVVIGYFVGYCGAFVVKDRSVPMILTMMYNVGLRNTSVGLVLALTYFPPPVAIPITMYVLFQQPLAAVIPYLLKRKTSAEIR
jgi:predicted Na+-dependent transporter